jgi:hypothetical protein
MSWNQIFYGLIVTAFEHLKLVILLALVAIAPTWLALHGSDWGAGWLMASEMMVLFTLSYMRSAGYPRFQFSIEGLLWLTTWVAIGCLTLRLDPLTFR